MASAAGSPLTSPTIATLSLRTESLAATVAQNAGASAAGTRDGGTVRSGTVIAVSGASVGATAAMVVEVAGSVAVGGCEVREQPATASNAKPTETAARRAVCLGA